MKKQDIQIGGKYAVKHRDLTAGQVVAAVVIRPADIEDWVCVIAGDGSVAERTIKLKSRAFIDRWNFYCVDSAHAAANAEDRRRTDDARYEAERAEVRDNRRPICDVFRGIAVPAESLSSGNFERPDEDLGQWLYDTFVDHYAHGASVGFDVFERIAAEMERLRETINTLHDVLADAGSGFVESERVDTGEPVVMQAEVNTPLLAVQRIAQAIDAQERGESPAGVT